MLPVALLILFVVPEDAFAMCVGLIILIGALGMDPFVWIGGADTGWRVTCRFQLCFDWLLRITKGLCTDATWGRLSVLDCGCGNCRHVSTE